MFKNCLHNLFQSRQSGVQLNAALVVSVVFLASFWYTRHGCSQSLFEWINTDGAFYDIGNNWSPVGPPDSIDVAQFLAEETYDVRWDSLTASISPDVGFVDVGTGNVIFQNQESTQYSFTINDDLTLFDSAQLTNSGLNLSVAGSMFVLSDATLLIEGSDPAGSQFNTTGQVLAPSGTITFDNGAIGDLSTLQLNVDSAGTAAVNVIGASNVTVDNIDIGNGDSQAPSSMGLMNVDGIGSSLAVDSSSGLVVGNSAGLGQHAINVTNGGSLDILLSTGEFQIEDSGSLVIDNGMTTLDQSGFFRIDGVAAITNGGALDSTSTVASIADGIGSNGQVTAFGSDTEWNNTGDLSVGEVGDGTLNVDAGGQVTNTSARIGNQISGTGLVTVSGAGSQWNNSEDLQIGVEGTGTLTVQAAGEVTSNVGNIGALSSGAGIANITGSGSQWINSFALVGNRGHGTLNIEDGGLVSNTGMLSHSSVPRWEWSTSRVAVPNGTVRVICRSANVETVR